MMNCLLCWSIFSHVELESWFDIGEGMDFNGFKFDIFADKLFKFVRGNFAETFETGDFKVFSQCLYRLVFFFFRIAVEGFFFIANFK